MSNLITKDQFKTVMPKNYRGSVDDSVINSINAVMGDPVLRENYRDNLLSYTQVMKEGKFKIQAYVDAVRYVSYKLFGSSNIDAYVKTFPDRYQRMVNEGMDKEAMHQYASAYNKTKLVNLIMEQTLIPSHILNADLYQKALNVQAELMISANSEKVRTDAANSLLTHLKSPETKKIELAVSHQEDGSIQELRQATLELAAQQRTMIQSNAMTAKEIAHSNLVIEGEIDET